VNWERRKANYGKVPTLQNFKRMITGFYRVVIPFAYQRTARVIIVITFKFERKQKMLIPVMNGASLFPLGRYEHGRGFLVRWRGQMPRHLHLSG
jgi:hypothetical protein